jgi:cold shock CspA family protein
VPTGTVTRLKLNRGLGGGFGFIATGARSAIFFHCSDLSPELVFDLSLEQRYVEYEIVETSRGPKAVNVRPAR